MSFLCRIGLHTAERSQGVVGYCLRGCGDLRRTYTNGRIWTRYVAEMKADEVARGISGLPPPPFPGCGDIARPPLQRVEIHVYHHGAE